MALSPDGFDRSVPLPPGLKAVHIKNAIEFIETRAEEWLDIYLEQANIFSAVIGILGVRALDSFSPYKRHKHPDIAQQRFPDLSLGGKLNPPPIEALESKGSTRPWAIQSHYDHPGWYIVWRYAVDPTKLMKPGRSVIVWRVDVPMLRRDHWKYEKRGAAEGQGGRTHTFGVKLPARVLANSIVYHAPAVCLVGGRPCLADSTP